MSVVTSCDIESEIITLHINGRDLRMSKATAIMVSNQLTHMLDGLKEYANSTKQKAMLDKAYQSH
jgi:hypothetical protein